MGVHAGTSADHGPPQGPPPGTGARVQAAGASPAVSPQVTGWRGGRKPRAETGPSEKHMLLSPCPALTTLPSRAGSSIRTNAGGGAGGLGPRGSSWTRSDPRLGLKGARTGAWEEGRGAGGGGGGRLDRQHPSQSWQKVWEAGRPRWGEVLRERVPAPQPGRATWLPREVPSAGLLCERRGCSGSRAGREVPSRQFLQSQAAFLPTLHTPLLPSSFQKGDSAEKAVSL